MNEYDKNRDSKQFIVTLHEKSLILRVKTAY